MAELSEKDRLRQFVKARRDALAGADRRQMSRAAALIALNHLRVRGQTVGLFYPIGSEIDARMLAPLIQLEGGKVCLPVTEGLHPLRFHLWDGDDEELSQSGFGTRAPLEGDVVLPDTLIMPLLGFDRAGNRLGWGQGHYDRTIAAMPSRPLLVGLAFACQELEVVAAEPHDVPLDLIVTDQEVIRVSKDC